MGTRSATQCRSRFKRRQEKKCSAIGRLKISINKPKIEIRKLSVTQAPTVAKKGGRRIRWTEQERADFTKYFTVYGRDWDKLASLITSKDKKSIMVYFYNHRQIYYPMEMSPSTAKVPSEKPELVGESDSESSSTCRSLYEDRRVVEVDSQKKEEEELARKQTEVLILLRNSAC